MGILGDLETAGFEELIEAYGEAPSFWLRRIGPCPVAHDDAFTGFSPQTTCPVCGGTGTAFQAQAVPVTGGKTGGLVFAAALSAAQAEAIGLELQAGDLRIRFLESEYAFAEGDRLGLPSRQADASELKIRGTGGGDVLRFTPALAVLAVFTPSGVLTPTAYSLSTDGRQIQFSGGSAPAVGTQYTVRYRWRPSYVFVESSFRRYPQATNGDYFPTRAVIRLWLQNSIDRKAGDQ